MITPDQGDSIGVADFEAEEKEEGFERVEASVDKIAHEQVVLCLGNRRQRGKDPLGHGTGHGYRRIW